MCTITVNNTGEPAWSVKLKQGDAVEVKMGPDSGSADTIFKGEVVGVEPTYDVKGESKVVIRSFNKLHRITRGRKSKTFANQTDAQIAQTVIGACGLSVQVSGDVNVKHDHVYQHNQTDFEFVLGRAARCGYEVVCDGDKVLFRKRDTSVASGYVLKLETAADYSLQKFTARLSSAGLVQEVNVRAWNPKTRETIIGKATAVANKMGGKDGGAEAQTPFSKVFYYDVDIPCFSVEEANAIAKSKLEELILSYITADGLCLGSAKLKAGIVVTVDCKDTRFNGKYYIVGASHRYTHKADGGGSGGGGGYLTAIRLRRNADS